MPPGSQQHQTLSMILAEYGGKCRKCYQLEKNQMQLIPSKFCFERRTRFLRITGINIAISAWKAADSFYFSALLTQLCCLSVSLPGPPVAAELLIHSVPALHKRQEYLSWAVSHLQSRLQIFFP